VGAPRGIECMYSPVHVWCLLRVPLLNESKPRPRGEEQGAPLRVRVSQREWFCAVWTVDCGQGSWRVDYGRSALCADKRLVGIKNTRFTLQPERPKGPTRRGRAKDGRCGHMPTLRGSCSSPGAHTREIRTLTPLENLIGVGGGGAAANTGAGLDAVIVLDTGGAAGRGRLLIPVLGARGGGATGELQDTGWRSAMGHSRRHKKPNSTTGARKGACHELM